ncbi:MAG: cation transporter [Planctomycetes bacterium]|nr:cation transporter [Planctomycetota bacterium]
MKSAKLLILSIPLWVAAGLLAAEPNADEKKNVQLGVEEVRVHVKGLACPFCAYNIEKRVKTLEGADIKAHFNVSLEKGIATFAWKSTVPFSPGAVNEQIKKAGFTPDTIDVTVSGQLVFKKPKDDGQPGQIHLYLQSTKQNIAISSVKRTDRPQSYALLLRKAKQLKEKSQFAVRIQATVLQENRSWKLRVDRWEPVAYGARVVIDLEKLACEQCATRVMRSLSKLEGVIHAEADHEINRTVVWTNQVKPDIDLLKKTVTDADFKVTRVQVLPKKKKPNAR